MDAGHWDVSAVGEFDPACFHGFIYEIEELKTGRLYVGRKKFRVKSQSKKSQWMAYTGSCEPLNEAIAEQGKSAFAFRILRLCSGQCELTYTENEIQHARDVLRAKLPTGERKYFNRAIGYKHYAGLEKQSDATKEKIRQALLGNHNCLGRFPTPETKRKIAVQLTGNRNAAGSVRTPESRERYSRSKKGIPKTPEHRAKLAEANIGKVQPPEVRAKIAVANSLLRWWMKGDQECRAVECPGEGWSLGRKLLTPPVSVG